VSKYPKVYINSVPTLVLTRSGSLDWGSPLLSATSCGTPWFYGDNCNRL